MGQSFEPNDPSKAREFFSDKMMFSTGPVEVSAALKEGKKLKLIDVRRAEDFNKAHVPGAINLPEGQWQETAKLSRDEMNVIYCYSVVCHLAARAAVQFAANGFPVMEMDGGFKAWQEHKLPIEGQEAGQREEERPKIDEFTATRMTAHHH